MSENARGERAGAPRVWHALEVTLKPEAREAVEYALMEAGARGCESRDGGDGRARAVAYFEAMPQREQVRAALFDALRIYDLPTESVLDMELRAVEDKDWLGEWKRNWRPVHVGGRFIVAPPWAEIDDPRERIVIRIEPGMAFGTGTHETTRLCLAAIERHFKGGSFLDVGAGTGILAIAAAKLFPGARVEACDTDSDALEIARENARLNDVAANIDFHAGTVGDATASADFVCANLTAHVIVPLLPALVGATCGRLILSGILDTQTELVRSQLRKLGITESEVATDGEWVAIII